MIWLPEEQELARLESEQANLEEQVVPAELALETIRNETAAFQQRYYRTVGHLYAKLDDVNAKIARIRAAQAPEDTILGAHAHSTQEEARRSSEEAGLIERQPKQPAVIDPALKPAYRKAAKLMHPDLATSEAERQRRTKLMASLNLAYARGQLKEVERLVVEFGQDPEAIFGEDVGSRIVKTIRRIAQLQRRLGELQLDLEAHKKSKAYELRQIIEAADARGDDPLGDLARQLINEISEREAGTEGRGIERLSDGYAATCDGDAAGDQREVGGGAEEGDGGAITGPASALPASRTAATGPTDVRRAAEGGGEIVRHQLIGFPAPEWPKSGME